MHDGLDDAGSRSREKTSSFTSLTSANIDRSRVHLFGALALAPMPHVPCSTRTRNSKALALFQSRHQQQ